MIKEIILIAVLVIGCLALLLAIAGIITTVVYLADGVIAIWSPRPSMIERRDAAIQECMALERYTIEQCIEIARDAR